MPDRGIYFSNILSAPMFWVNSATLCSSPSWKPLLCCQKKKKWRLLPKMYSFQNHFAYCMFFQVKYTWPNYFRFCDLTTSFQKAKGVGGRETSMYCYPAIFTWLWEYKLVPSGAVPQHLGQHLTYGRTSTHVCWMTKWMNDGLPAPKFGLSFQ